MGIEIEERQRKTESVCRQKGRYMYGEDIKRDKEEMLLHRPSHLIVTKYFYMHFSTDRIEHCHKVYMQDVLTF